MFGTYDPRRSLFPKRAPDPGAPRKRASVLPLLFSALTLASVVLAVWSYSEMRRTTLVLDRITGLSGVPPAGSEGLGQPEGPARHTVGSEARDLTTKLIEIQAAKERAEQSAKDLAARLAQERQSRENAAQSAKEVQELLARELRANENLSQVAKLAKDQFGQERVARLAAEKLAKDASDQLDRLRLAKGTTDRTAKEGTDKCEQERTSRALAERNAQDAMDHLSRERNARAAAELAANELRNQLVSIGTEPLERISELRNRIEAEHRAKEIVEREAKEMQQELAQEKHSRDSAERALRHTQQKLQLKLHHAGPVPPQRHVIGHTNQPVTGRDKLLRYLCRFCKLIRAEAPSLEPKVCSRQASKNGMVKLCVELLDQSVDGLLGQTTRAWPPLRWSA